MATVLFSPLLNAVCMVRETELVRCPACGSILTEPSVTAGMWECRYYLCRAVFPVQDLRGIREETGVSSNVIK